MNGSGALVRQTGIRSVRVLSERGITHVHSTAYFLVVHTTELFQLQSYTVQLYGCQIWLSFGWGLIWTYSRTDFS